MYFLQTIHSVIFGLQTACCIPLLLLFFCTKDGKSWAQKDNQVVVVNSKSGNVYEEKVEEIRKKILIAKAEVERLQQNQKLTKRGKRNRAILRKECYTMSSLVGYMERQKSLLRKLKKGFVREEKQEEARTINRQFEVDASRVYAGMRETLAKDKENDRPWYTDTRKNSTDGKMFNNIEEASSFWKSLWEGNGTGNGNA